jgi:hypothetical protein
MNSIKQVSDKLAAGKPVYIDFYSKCTGEQTRLRVIAIKRIASGEGFTVQGINGEVSEPLTFDRVAFPAY